jgi:hypothetical protein
VTSWLAKRILSRNMAKPRAGDYRPLLRGDAKDVRFRFPGNSSFATKLQGKDALEQWLKRLVVRVRWYLDPNDLRRELRRMRVISPAIRSLVRALMEV